MSITFLGVETLLLDDGETLLCGTKDPLLAAVGFACDRSWGR